jgi:hypothetical protein
LIELDFAYC